MRVLAVVLAAAGCGSSSSPAPEHPAPSPAPVAAAPADAAPPDAPDVPDEVANAPAWVFKYTAPNRAETWTLRHANGRALLVVETATGTTRYAGTATEGASLAVAVATRTAKMGLDCKHEQLAVSAKCNDQKAKKRDVLNCYHPDFKAPMPFGPAPGIEYVQSDACTGYRLVP